MAKSHLKLVAPATEKRTVRPTRRPNADLRSREHLTPVGQGSGHLGPFWSHLSRRPSDLREVEAGVAHFFKGGMSMSKKACLWGPRRAWYPFWSARGPPGFKIRGLKPKVYARLHRAVSVRGSHWGSTSTQGADAPRSLGGSRWVPFGFPAGGNIMAPTRAHGLPRGIQGHCRDAYALPKTRPSPMCSPCTALSAPRFSRCRWLWATSASYRIRHTAFIQFFPDLVHGAHGSQGHACPVGHLLSREAPEALLHYPPCCLSLRHGCHR